MSDWQPMTMEELLPAIIETLSIQSDLLGALEHGSPKTRAGVFVGSPPQLIDRYEMKELRMRTRSLLAYLLQRTEGMPEPPEPFPPPL